MGRLFTPGGFGTPSKDAPLTVSQVAGRIESTIRSTLREPMRVIGQVSGFRERTHWYFDLKDAESVLGCVMWQSSARRLAFVPEDGQEVVVTATVDYYAKQGRLSLIVSRLEPVGAGALELAYRALCDELRGLGYFDVDRKRALPAHPRRIGVITSRSSAALQDVIDTMRRRCPFVDLALIDARVQGEEAADEIVRAIRFAGGRHEKLGLDALLITRGGGSMEDLWCFNERRVADAIMTCEIPVVAAIGHETDTTIAELVADARGATPTQAAMLLTPDGAALAEQLDALSARLRGRVRHALEIGRRHVDALATRPALRDPHSLVRAGEERVKAVRQHLVSTLRTNLAEQRHLLDTRSARLERHRPVAQLASRLARLEVASARLRQCMATRLVRQADHLEMAKRELRAVGPISVLERGYSCTMTETGALVRSPKDVRLGDLVRTRLAQGAIVSRVEAETTTPRKGSTRSERPPPDQMDLFTPEP